MDKCKDALLQATGFVSAITEAKADWMPDSSALDDMGLLLQAIDVRPECGYTKDEQLGALEKLHAKMDDSDYHGVLKALMQGPLSAKLKSMLSKLCADRAKHSAPNTLVAQFADSVDKLHKGHIVLPKGELTNLDARLKAVLVAVAESGSKKHRASLAAVLKAIVEYAETARQKLAEEIKELIYLILNGADSGECKIAAEVKEQRGGGR